MYKSLIIITLLLCFTKGICQSETPIITDTIILYRAEVNDSIFYRFIDTLLENEVNCDYFTDDISISLRIQGVRNNQTIVPNKYRFILEAVEMNKLLYVHRTAFFYYKSHYIFTSGLDTLPSQFFTLTKEYKEFYHTKNPMDEIVEDDSHSIHIYWYINGEFYIGDKWNCLE